MDIAWTHVGPTIIAAFSASLVEFVEALTVVLAVGSVRGWRAALLGGASALIVLLAIVAVLGPVLREIPLRAIQLAVGVLLLLFGLRWLRKAILRAAGIIALHDETAAFSREAARMRTIGAIGGWDRVAFGASFQITLMEGTEVVFIVIALGAGGTDLLLPASLGALAALVAVLGLGVALHRPLTNVPENGLKFGVGVLLSAFGTFWVGEGIGFGWFGADWAILALIIGFAVVALLTVRLCAPPRAVAVR